MEGHVTEYQVSSSNNKPQLFQGFAKENTNPSVATSSQILELIYQTVNSPRNYRKEKSHKMSITIEDTHHTVIAKCNCKKSKCLKLYCECFAQGKNHNNLGSFCKDCNCSCCQNTEEFSDIRAKAID